MTAWARATVECVVCPRCGFTFAAEDVPKCLRCKGKKAPADPAAETPDAMLWRVWRALYAVSVRRYGAYTSAPGDALIAKRVAMHAMAECETLGHSGEAEALVTHWLKSYLRDDGSKFFSLRDNRHGLRWLERSISAYGNPWTRAISSPQRLAETRPEDLPAREVRRIAAAAPIPADVRAAVGGLGAGPRQEATGSLEERQRALQAQARSLVEQEQEKRR